MTNDYVNHENMIMLIMVSDLLNDYVDYGKWLFRSYTHDHVVLFKRWENGNKYK